MKLPDKFLAGVFGLVGLTTSAFASLSAWQREQTSLIPSNGVIRMNLPVETIDSARPGLVDLRIFNPVGAETPYWIVRPAVMRRWEQPSESFRVKLGHHSSIIRLETIRAQAVDGITLWTPARNFIKPVAVDASSDGTNWERLADGLPIFRQSDGAEQLHLAIPAGAWPWVRLTVDDSQSPPIPFTGAVVDVVPSNAPLESSEWVSVPILNRDEQPRESRLTLDLGGANQEIAEIQIDSPASLFARSVTLMEPRMADDSVREQVITTGSAYRLALGNGPVSESLAVRVGCTVPSRQVTLVINKGDAPPLPVDAIRIKRRVMQILFDAEYPGEYRFLTGNPSCSPPSYDTLNLGRYPQNVPLSAQSLSPLKTNADYVAPEALPGIKPEGAALDVVDWRFRKPVNITNDGVQELELDLDTLAHAQPSLGDLRLVFGNRQIPFIVEHPATTRAIPLASKAEQGVPKEGMTQWSIHLPQIGTPITRLSCTTSSALFERNVSVVEELHNDRGESYWPELARENWIRTPTRTNGEFILTLDRPPGGKTIFLQTHNGDNPPIILENFRGTYPVTRILFKAAAHTPVYLYYGNPRVGSPSYDLGLVAGELAGASRSSATNFAEEQLKVAPVVYDVQTRAGSAVLWGAMAAVVVALLWVIARLLPKAPPPSA